MSVLFLLSEEDKAKLNPEILIESVLLRTDPEASSELFLNDYDSVFITSNYTKTYGSSLVENIVKSLKTFTQSYVQYLVNESEVNTDSVIPFLIENDIGNIYKIDVSKLSLNMFKRIRSSNKSSIGLKSSKEIITKERLALLKNELENITNDDFQKFTKENKGLIKDTVTSYIKLIDEKEKLENKIDALNNENIFQSKRKLEYIFENQSLKKNNKILQDRYIDLRNSVIEQKDKITNYNQNIVRNSFNIDTIIPLGEFSPPILYFKELEDIGFYQYFNSIKYMFKDVYKVYVKTIIIERPGRNFFNPYIKDGYKVINEEGNYEDLIRNDDIVVFSNPMNILSGLIKPELKLEVLIIYDRTQTDSLLLKGNYIQPYYLGNTRNNYINLDIDDESFISPYEGEWKEIKRLLHKQIKDEQDYIIYSTFVVNSRLVKNIIQNTIDI